MPNIKICINFIWHSNSSISIHKHSDVSSGSIHSIIRHQKIRMTFLATNWETEFLGEPITKLSDKHLPTLGELLRLYCHYRQLSSLARKKRRRNDSLLCSNKCIEIWKKFGIPTALGHNVNRNLTKTIALFKSINFPSCHAKRKKKEILWRRKLQLVFNVAAKDAVKKCRGKNRKLLQDIAKEAEELKSLEGSIAWNRNSNVVDELSALLVNNETDETKNRSLKRKAENVRENTMKRCKVLVSRMGAKTYSGIRYFFFRCKWEDLKVNRFKVVEHYIHFFLFTDDELKENVISKPYVSSSEEFISRSSSIDVHPNDEDIVPPNLPVIIIKEELDINWDENDNMQAALPANYNEDMGEDNMFGKRIRIFR